MSSLLLTSKDLLRSLLKFFSDRFSSRKMLVTLLRSFLILIGLLHVSSVVGLFAAHRSIGLKKFFAYLLIISPIGKVQIQQVLKLFDDSIVEAKVVYLSTVPLLQLDFSRDQKSFVTFLPYSLSQARRKITFVGVKDGKETVLNFHPGLSLLVSASDLGYDEIKEVPIVRKSLYSN